MWVVLDPVQTLLVDSLKVHISYTPHRRCLWNLETEGEARGFQIP